MRGTATPRHDEPDALIGHVRISGSPGGAIRQGDPAESRDTYLVVDALIKANKDFDLIIIPNAGHAYGSASNYVVRRRWDYFVRGLLGAEPPKEYLVKAGGGGRGGRAND